jgi:hypothetical protein
MYSVFKIHILSCIIIILIYNKQAIDIDISLIYINSYFLIKLLKDITDLSHVQQDFIQI